MADSIIILPPVATTSGDLLDATAISVGGVTVKRERMVIGNDTSSHVATVSSSGALRTLSDISGSFPLIITGSVITAPSSNETVVLSSPTSLSSGLITLTGTNVVTNASSGLVQVLQSTGAWAVTGGGSTAVTLIGSTGQAAVVTSSGGLSVAASFSATSTASNIIGSTGTTAGVSSGGGLYVNIVSSAGIFAPVTSSAGLLVSATVAGTTAVNILGSTGTMLIVTSEGVLSAGILSSGGIYAPVTSSGGLLIQVSTQGSGFMASTAINILGSTGTIWDVSSAGVGEASVQSSGGIYAPVTSSGGIKSNLGSTAILLGVLTATLGAPVLKILTTAPIIVYSLSLLATAGTAGNVYAFYSATSALSSDVAQFAITNAVAVSNYQVCFSRGIPFNKGIQFLGSVSLGSTGTNTSGAVAYIEYEV